MVHFSLSGLIPWFIRSAFIPDLKTVLTVLAILAAIGSPFIWAGEIKAENVGQNKDIESNANDILKQERRIDALVSDIGVLKSGMNALLINHGINPDKLK